MNALRFSVGRKTGIILTTGAVTSRRSYVQAFLRTPSKGNVPSQSTKGEAIDRDELFFQFNLFIDELRKSALVDTVNLMEEFGGSFESVQPADLMSSYGSEALLMMPQYGREHRQAELAETMRYLRASGAPSQMEDLLQKEEKARAHPGDFILLPECTLVAESSRTNRWTIEMLRTAFSEKEQYKVFNVYHTKISDSAPPLGDMVAYAGDGSLLYWNNPDGKAVAQYVAENVKRRQWHLVPVPPGTVFLSFWSGLPRYDVMVDEDDEPAIGAMHDAGLNPIPVSWSEWRKLGISMRSMVLVLRFARGGFSGGGVHTHRNFAKSQTRIYGTPKGSKKERGLAGAPLWSQLRTGEIDMCYQPPPRYAPPMHRPGPVALRGGDDDSNNNRGR